MTLQEIDMTLQSISAHQECRLSPEPDEVITTAIAYDEQATETAPQFYHQVEMATSLSTKVRCDAESQTLMSKKEFSNNLDALFAEIDFGNE